jgi:hypothetical protein
MSTEDFEMLSSVPTQESLDSMNNEQKKEQREDQLEEQQKEEQEKKQKEEKKKVKFALNFNDVNIDNLPPTPEAQNSFSKSSENDENQEQLREEKKNQFKVVYACKKSAWYDDLDRILTNEEIEDHRETWLNREDYLHKQKEKNEPKQREQEQQQEPRNQPRFNYYDHLPKYKNKYKRAYQGVKDWFASFDYQYYCDTTKQFCWNHYGKIGFGIYSIVVMYNYRSLMYRDTLSTKPPHDRAGRIFHSTKEEIFNACNRNRIDRLGTAMIFPTLYPFTVLYSLFDNYMEYLAQGVTNDIMKNIHS